MDRRSTGVLRQLRETGKTVAEPVDDVRGHTVVDRDGEEVGRVDDLLVDDADDAARVRFLSVSEGGFLGLGATHYLVPVEAVVAVERDRVQIDRQRSGMEDVPGYDPELVPLPAYYGDVYGWWGVPPYWGPGYR